VHIWNEVYVTIACSSRRECSVNVELRSWWH